MAYGTDNLPAPPDCDGPEVTDYDNLVFDMTSLARRLHCCVTIERDGARYIEEWIRSHADLIKSEGLLDGRV